ncbi:hypothetical protein ACFL1H_06705, partial [Nanoarchaeota archaeon]
MARMRSAKEIASDVLYGIVFNVDKSGGTINKLRNDFHYLDLIKNNEYKIKKDNEIVELQGMAEYKNDIFYCGKGIVKSLFSNYKIDNLNTFYSDLIVYNNSLYYLTEKIVFGNIDKSKLINSPDSMKDLSISNNELYISVYTNGQSHVHKYLGFENIYTSDKYEKRFPIVINEDLILTTVDFQEFWLNEEVIPGTIINKSIGIS